MLNTPITRVTYITNIILKCMGYSQYCGRKVAREGHDLSNCRVLCTDVKDHTILTDLQHGSRSGRSCDTQLTFQDLS